MHVTFQTERLILRPLQVTDADAFASLVDNPAITRMTGTFPNPFPRVSVYGLVEIFVARAATGKAHHWAILKDGNFMGAIGLYRKTSGWDLGYWIGEPYWGQGYTSEAVKGLLAHMQGHADPLTISACVFTDNPASAKVLKNAGFEQHEGICNGYSLARRSDYPNWNFTFNSELNGRKSASASATVS